VVTAADIQLDHDVEIVDPRHVIATLTKGATLNVELKVIQGRGYQPVTARAQAAQGEGRPIGAMSSCSIYARASSSSRATRFQGWQRRSS